MKVKQITFAAPAPRHILIVERADGTWNILEDEEQALRAYRPKRGENVSRYRAYVRRTP